LNLIVSKTIKRAWIILALGLLLT